MAGWRAWAAGVIAALALHPAAAAPARRIVSINLCADVLVLTLAERRHIAAVSTIAADPVVSPVAARARGLPTNRADAEAIVALDPDVVVAAEYSATATRALLAHLGVPVVVVRMAHDLAGVRAEIARVAAALGVAGRGRAVVAAMAARLARLPPPAPVPPTVALLGPGGWESSAGSLAGAVLAAAGFRLYETTGGRTTLERLAMHPPDALVIDESYAEAPSLANERLAHPALVAAIPAAHRVAIPARLWICPGPAVAEAALRLARFRLALARSGG